MTPTPKARPLCAEKWREAAGVRTSNSLCLPPGARTLMAVRDIALPASYALGLDSLSALRRRLDNDSALRAVCGFANRLPGCPTFRRLRAVGTGCGPRRLRRRNLRGSGAGHQALHGRIRRGSAAWQAKYHKRWSVAPVFSGWKNRGGWSGIAVLGCAPRASARATADAGVAGPVVAEGPTRRF